MKLSRAHLKTPPLLRPAAQFLAVVLVARVLAGLPARLRALVPASLAKNRSHVLVTRLGFEMCSSTLFTFLLILGGVLGTLLPVWADDGHDHNDLPSGKGKISNRPDAPNQHRGACTVRPDTLADFANGVSYDMPKMVSFLTAPECVVASRMAAAAAMDTGINFRSKAPFNLEKYASLIDRNNLASFDAVDTSVTKATPEWLRNAPLGTKELYPILGQVALFSNSAAKQVLVNLIERELYSADEALLRAASPSQKDKVTVDLSLALTRMGASEPSVATELATNIEEKAILAQADSLAKIFRSLGAATNAEPRLEPTFNLSAQALNRGVQRSAKANEEPANQSELTKAVFEALKAAVNGGDNLEEGTVDLNEALGSLMAGKSLDNTSLKQLWKEVLLVLTQTENQMTLADAFAASLKVSVVYLSPAEMHRVLVAAKNYASLALALQRNYLVALEENWNLVKRGKLTLAKFNQLKGRFLEPLVSEILDLGVEKMDRGWLAEVYKRGFVSDVQVEKRFPRSVLSILEKRDQSSRIVAKEHDLEGTLRGGVQDLISVVAMTEVYVPALMQWVQKYESEQ